MDFPWMTYAFQCVNLQSIVLFVILLGFYSLLFQRNKPSTNLPPGPNGLPFVGSLLSMSLHSERNMYEWNKRYGPVCRLKMARLEFILLGSMEAVEEAFVKKSEIFSDRLANSIQGMSGNSGIIFLCYNELLKQQRRFGLATLKEFGMGRKSIEPWILERCGELCEEIETRSEDHEPFEINILLYRTVSSVISQLVFNKNLAVENEGFRNFLARIASGLKYSEIGALTLFVPSLKYIPPFSWNAKESKRLEANTYRMIQEQIEDHKRTRDPNEPRDYIDCFLNKREKLEKSGEDPAIQGFSDEQLNFSLRDLFLAGSETTATTICWAVLYLSRNSDVQASLQKEIDDVLGQGRQLSTSLYEQMPYVRAVVQETLRIRPVAPMGVPHLARREGTIQGYRIPKGAIVVSNQFRIQNDENIWSNPEKFDPTRHLNEEGQFFKSPNVMPFSVGARQCLGLQLANMELFLVISSLFCKFSFTLPPGQNIDMRGKNIFVLRPYPYKVIASRRY